MDQDQGKYWAIIKKERQEFSLLHRLSMGVSRYKKKRKKEDYITLGACNNTVCGQNWLIRVLIRIY